MLGMFSKHHFLSRMGNKNQGVQTTCSTLVFHNARLKFNEAAAACTICNKKTNTLIWKLLVSFIFIHVKMESNGKGRDKGQFQPFFVNIPFL